MRPMTNYSSDREPMRMLGGEPHPRSDAREPKPEEAQGEEAKAKRRTVERGRKRVPVPSNHLPPQGNRYTRPPKG